MNKSPSIQTIKRLYALSGNLCAFPKCNLPMVESSGTLGGEISHIMAKSKGFARFDLNQSDEDRHGFENLVLLCRRHHKIVDSEPDIYTAEILVEMKLSHETIYARPEEDSDIFFAKFLLNDLSRIEVNQNSGNVAINSSGVIQGHTIHVKNQRSVFKIAPPIGSIGSDVAAAGYIEYLIKRYLEFASVDKNRATKFNPGRFRKTLERTFKSHYRLLPLEKFDAFQEHLKEKIDQTILGKNRRAKGQSSYSTFDEWRLN